MRCFVAALFDDPTRERLERLLALVRSGDAPVRWVRAEGLHATLAFLGELSEVQAQAAARALHDALGRQAAIPVHVGDVGGFPSSRAARVVWVGVREPTGRLADVQASLVQRLRAAGLTLDDAERFHPHVTLGRAREGKVSAERCASRLSKVDVTPAPGYVCSVVLFQSDLGPGGARYTPLEAVHLGGTP